MAGLGLRRILELPAQEAKKMAWWWSRQVRDVEGLAMDTGRLGGERNKERGMVVMPMQVREEAGG